MYSQSTSNSPTLVWPAGVILLEYAPALMQATGYTNPASLLHSLYTLGYHTITHAGYVCDERWANLTATTTSSAGPSATDPKSSMTGSGSSTVGTISGSPISSSSSSRGDSHGSSSTSSGSSSGSRGDSHGSSSTSSSSSSSSVDVFSDSVDGSQASVRGRQGGIAGVQMIGLPATLQRQQQPTWCKLQPSVFDLLTSRAHREVPENILFIHNSHVSTHKGRKSRRRAKR